MFAEDATKHAASALSLPWYHAIFKPLGDYYSFLNNLVITLIVKLTPITQWPLWIAIACLLLLLLCFAIPYYSSSFLWKQPWQRQAVPIIIALVGLRPIYDNVWLNIVNFQFFLLLATALILFSEATSYMGVRLRNMTVLIAALTGVTSSSLAPFFIAKAAWHYRKGSDAFHRHLHTALIISLAATIATTITFFAAQNHRFIGITPSAYTGYLSNRQILPVLLPSKALEVAIPLIYQHWRWAMIDIGALLLIFFLSKEEIAAFIVIFYITSFSFLTCLGDKLPYAQMLYGGGRYQLAPAILLTLLILSRLMRTRYPKSLKAACLVALMFPATMDYATKPYPTQFEIDGNHWWEEANTLISRGFGEIRIWPQGVKMGYCDPELCNPSMRHELARQGSFIMDDSRQQERSLNLKWHRLGTGTGFVMLNISARIANNTDLHLQCREQNGYSSIQRTITFESGPNNSYIPFKDVNRADWACHLTSPNFSGKITVTAYY